MGITCKQKRFIFLATTLFFSIWTSSISLTAQGLFYRPLHDVVWALDGNMIDFRTEPISIYENENSTAFSVESLSTFFDVESQSLWATNGTSVYDYLGNILENGDSLSFHPTTAENLEGGHGGPDRTLMLPSFDDSNAIKVFHLPQRIQNPPDTLDIIYIIDHLLSSDVVDIHNPDSIRVINKNTVVYPDTLDQGLSAVRHGNGRDWWVVLNSRKRNEQHVLLYSPEGIEHVQTQRFSPDTLFIGLGQSRFSPNGSFYAKVKFRYVGGARMSEVMIYEFNRCTGVLKKKAYITAPFANILRTNGVAFSPNNRFLYATFGTYLVQYDLFATDVEASGEVILDVFDLPPEEIADGVGIWMMQLGPDGKIYVGTQGPDFLHIIHRPNLKGVACQFDYKAIALPTFVVSSMPNLPPYGTGPLPASACDTLGIYHLPPVANFEYITDDSLTAVAFFDSSSTYVDTYEWDFGDGNNSTLQHPTHDYVSPGTYFVCLTVGSLEQTHTHCDSVTVGNDLINRSQDLSRIDAKLWPNPTDRLLFFEFQDNQTGSIVVYNLFGQAILTKTVNRQKTVTLDLVKVTSGMYHVELKSPTGLSLLKRNIIIK